MNISRSAPGWGARWLGHSKHTLLCLGWFCIHRAPSVSSRPAPLPLGAPCISSPSAVSPEDMRDAKKRADFVNPCWPNEATFTDNGQHSPQVPGPQHPRDMVDAMGAPRRRLADGCGPLSAKSLTIISPQPMHAGEEGAYTLSQKHNKTSPPTRQCHAAPFGPHSCCKALAADISEV